MAVSSKRKLCRICGVDDMELKIMDVLSTAIEKNASDIYLVAGGPLAIKINGEIVNYTEEKLTHIDTSKLIHEIYAIYELDDEFAYVVEIEARNTSIPNKVFENFLDITVK